MIKRAFYVGDIFVQLDDAMNQKRPDQEVFSALNETFWEKERNSNSLLEAVSTSANNGSHPWVNLMLAIAHEALLDDSPMTYLENFLKQEEWVATVPKEFNQLTFGFFKHIIWPLHDNYFHIGKQWVKHDVVCQSLPPTPNELAITYKLFSVLIANGSPIMRTLKILAECTSHPWLIMFYSVAFEQVRTGYTLSQGITDGIREFHTNRIQKFKEGSIEPENCFLPNFLATFAYDLGFIKAGEETGELDTCLLHLFQHHLNEPQILLWSYEVQKFLEDLSTLQNSGLPILRSLMILRDNLTLCDMKSELAQICERIECGMTLSEAIEKVDGQLNNPMILAMIRVAEETGRLEIFLSELKDLDF